MKLSIHLFRHSSVHPSSHPSVPSWSVYPDKLCDQVFDAAEKEWNTDCCSNKSSSSNRKRQIMSILKEKETTTRIEKDAADNKRIILPRTLTTVETSFTAWNHDTHDLEFSFDTQPVPMSTCKQPFLFYMEEMHVVERNRQTVSMYKRYSKVDEAKKHAYCWFHHMAPQRLKQITVVTDFVAMQWYMVCLSWCVPQLCISVWCLPVSHVSLVSGQVHDNRIAAIVLP